MRRSSVYLVAGMSGISALVFETLWFVAAGRVVGNGVWSTVLVLTTFMAGLALGNLAAIVLERRIQNPLRTYAGIEFTVGAAGLAGLLVFQHLAHIIAPLLGAFTDRAWLLNSARIAIAFTVLVVPAIAMGATLPTLVKALAGDPQPLGHTLGRAYAANTAGAVAGILIAEFLLIPAVGITGSGLAAALLCCAAGLLSLSLARTYRVAQPPARKARATAVPRLQVRAAPLVAASALSGAIFLGFEASLFRFQMLFFTALSTTFAVMLALVLLGLALGGAAASWFSRRTPAVAGLLPAFALLAGAALGGAYATFPQVLEPALGLSAPRAVAATTAWLVFPVAVLSGAMFTMMGDGLHRGGFTRAGATAVVTLANTLGAAAGSVLIGLVLVQAAGLERTFFALACLYGVVALLLAVAFGRAAWAYRPWSIAAGAAFAAAIALFPHGAMQAIYHEFPANGLKPLGEYRVAITEGQTDTIQYLQADLLGRPDYHRLIVNNHSMAASDVRGRRYMRLFAHVPTILHPSPTRAALVGIGLGVTAKALTDDPRLTAIDVVDTSRDIASMLPVVYPNPADNPLEDPRVRLHIEDGRFFLASTRSGYDVITAEPPPPHYVGVANLYSRQFFELVSARLNPGGFATYWLPVHDLTAGEARAILAAFLAVFPDGTLWTGAGLEWMMAGVKPLARASTQEQIAGWWASDRLGSQLRSIGIDDPETLGSLFIASADRLRAWVGATPLVTDDFPRRVSTGIARDDADVAAFLALMNSPDAAADFASSPSIAAIWPAPLRAEVLPRFPRQARVNTMMAAPALRVGDLEQLFAGDPRDPLLIKALFWRSSFDFDRTREFLDRNPNLTGAGLAEFRAQQALMDGRPREAAEWLGRARSPRADRLRTIQVYSVLAAGDRAEAAARLQRRSND